MFMYGGKMFSNLILKRRSNADCLTLSDKINFVNIFQD